MTGIRQFGVFCLALLRWDGRGARRYTSRDAPQHVQQGFPCYFSRFKTSKDRPRATYCHHFRVADPGTRCISLCLRGRVGQSVCGFVFAH